MPKHYRPPGKKKEGNAAKYVTRTQAVNQIDVTLHGFRRLCILKGIFPREPKKKFKGTHQTYYHTKDILFLKHEPLVEKFREQKVHDRKVKKAMSKKNRDLAQRLMTRKPEYSLDRIILERYPRFIDALGDLDDCLSMVHLFAALPALDSEKIGVDRVHNCRRLSHEWQAYISRTHKLRKTFISVKGIYYQAEILGQKITWVTPHALQQVISDDVDFSVMLALLGFVNFKLYHSIQVEYPPILDPRLEALAADLYALSRLLDAKSAHKTLQLTSGSENDKPETGDGKPDESELRLAQLQHQLPSNESGGFMHQDRDSDDEDDEDEDTKECKALFKNMKFFLSREVPRESLLFIIPAFGGSVSWEGEASPFNELDESITHQIVDRPTVDRKFLSREYVQPQWVFDCVNARIILPTEEYCVGRAPPPHLSPFVDNEAEGYLPEYAAKIKQLQA
ncbi:Pescadillo-like protein, partial [Drosera capensis]